METDLALTRSIATQIVETVQADPECKRRIPKVYDDAIIKSPLSRGLGEAFGSIGIAGSLRNLSNPKMFLVPDYEPTQAESDLACTGIGTATAAALSARSKREPGFPVASADTVSRQSAILGTHHTATTVKLRSGETFVFDWHATLMIGNPMIHPAVDAWMHDLDGILFSRWTGKASVRVCAEKKR
jgi:hypothetical protein